MSERKKTKKRRDKMNFEKEKTIEEKLNYAEEQYKESYSIIKKFKADFVDRRYTIPLKNNNTTTEAFLERLNTMNSDMNWQTATEDSIAFIDALNRGLNAGFRELYTAIEELDTSHTRLLADYAHLKPYYEELVEIKRIFGEKPLKVFTNLSERAKQGEAWREKYERLLEEFKYLTQRINGISALPIENTSEEHSIEPATSGSIESQIEESGNEEPQEEIEPEGEDAIKELFNSIKERYFRKLDDYNSKPASKQGRRPSVPQIFSGLITPPNGIFSDLTDAEKTKAREMCPDMEIRFNSEYLVQSG